ncbi:jg7932, partial [Pararge aegeria aegeria]
VFGTADYGINLPIILLPESDMEGTEVGNDNDEDKDDPKDKFIITKLKGLTADWRSRQGPSFLSPRPWV